MKEKIKFKKNLILKRIIFLLLLVITFYIIFNFSAQDGEESGNLSRKVTEIIIEIVSKIKSIDMNLKLNYIETLHPIVRKLAHFSIYTVVGFSIMGFMCTFDIKDIIKFASSLGIGLIYAITDETHQYFTPGRSAQVLDVCIDGLGVLTGICILVLLIILGENIINCIKRKNIKNRLHFVLT